MLHWQLCRFSFLNWFLLLHWLLRNNVWLFEVVFLGLRWALLLLLWLIVRVVLFLVVLRDRLVERCLLLTLRLLVHWRAKVVLLLVHWCTEIVVLLNWRFKQNEIGLDEVHGMKKNLKEEKVLLPS